jgi:hypothetical protein
MAFHVGHDIEEESLGFTGVVDREDVRVGQPRGELDFAQESLGANFSGDFWLENL